MGRRESFLTLASRSFWIWFGGIWLLMGILFLVATVWVAGYLQAIQRSGEMAEGVVREKRLDKQALLPHTVRYRFPTPDGQTFEDDGALPKEQWDALRDGGPVRVRYDPKRPIFNQLEQEQVNVWLVVIFLGTGVLLTRIGGGIVLSWSVKLRRFLRLQEHGMMVEGTVLDVPPTGLVVNYERLHIVRYQYRDHQGQTRKGASRPMAPIEALRWKPGERGAVRYDRSRPSISEWMGTRWGE